MRFSELFGADRLSAKRAIRILAMTAAILVLAEIGTRMATLYPYIPGQRFHNMWSAAALAPNARQIGEAVDYVREHAKAGDWVLVGDSVLNGTHVPRDFTPASVIRKALHDRGSGAQVWDLTLVGSDPGMYNAILDRIGPLSSVMLVTNVSVKLVAHSKKDELYYPEMWDEMAHWRTSSAQTQAPLEELRDRWFADYDAKEHTEYGDNAAEARVAVWLNTHVSLLTLDHWLRYQFTDLPWPQLFSSILLNGWKFWGAKDFDVIWQEWPHEPTTKVLSEVDKVRDWFAHVPAADEPMWRAYLLYLNRLQARGKYGLVSLHTLSPYATRLLPAELQQGITQAYSALKGEITRRGIPFVEPGTFMPEMEYTDLDHFGSAGNRRWTEALMQKAHESAGM